jgi:hypothetical protein
VHGTNRETDVLDESRKEILVADVYTASVVSDGSSLPDVDYFSCLGGD